MNIFKKRKLQKQMKIELLETMCTICLYLEEDSKRTPTARRYTYHFESHFEHLKELSCALRNEEYKPIREVRF